MANILLLLSAGSLDPMKGFLMSNSLRHEVDMVEQSRIKIRGGCRGARTVVAWLEADAVVRIISFPLAKN